MLGLMMNAQSDSFEFYEGNPGRVGGQVSRRLRPIFEIFALIYEIMMKFNENESLLYFFEKTFNQTHHPLHQSNLNKTIPNSASRHVDHRPSNLHTFQRLSVDETRAFTEPKEKRRASYTQGKSQYYSLCDDFVFADFFDPIDCTRHFAIM